MVLASHPPGDPGTMAPASFTVRGVVVGDLARVRPRLAYSVLYGLYSPCKAQAVSALNAGTPSKASTPPAADH